MHPILGDLVKVVHPILGDVLGTFGSLALVDVGLPIPVIECLIALPLSTLEELNFIVLVNSLWVPLGGSCMLPLGKCRLEWVVRVVLILKEWGIIYTERSQLSQLGKSVTVVNLKLWL